VNLHADIFVVWLITTACDECGTMQQPDKTMTADSVKLTVFRGSQQAGTSPTDAYHAQRTTRAVMSGLLS